MDICDTTLLLVDDDRSFVATWLDAFRLRGITADGECNPTKVATKIKNKKYDAILLDLNMSPKSGFQVLLDIGTYSAHSKVIIFAGGNAIQDIVDCLKHGACDYIPKTVTPEQLVERLEVIMSRPELVLVEATMRENLIKALWSNVQYEPTNEKGTKLEMLMKHLFDSIPGLMASLNVRQGSDEFDLIVDNNRTDPFWVSLKSLMPVECKKWDQSKPSTTEFDHFHTKLERFSDTLARVGLFVSYNGFTGGFIDRIRETKSAGQFIVPIGEPALRSLVEMEDAQGRAHLLRDLVTKVGQHEGDLTLC